MVNNVAGASLEANRRLLEDALAPYLKVKNDAESNLNDSQMSVLDAILMDDLRQDFISICNNMQMFGSLYDYIIANLVEVAKEAKETHKLSRAVVSNLVTNGLEHAGKVLEGDNAKEVFGNWFKFFINYSKRSAFLVQVEEWKKNSFPRLSETLFVIITFFFEKLLGEYYDSKEGKRLQR